MEIGEVDDASQANSSMLGAVISESTFKGIEKLNQPPQFSNDKESETNYSNFKS